MTDWHRAIGHQSTQKGFRRRAAPSFSPLTAPISTFPRAKSLQRITEQPAEPGSRSNREKSPQTCSFTGTPPVSRSFHPRRWRAPQGHGWGQSARETCGHGLSRGRAGCPPHRGGQAGSHPGLGQQGCRAGQLSHVWGQEPGPSVRLKPSVREGAVPTITPRTGDGRAGPGAPGPPAPPTLTSSCRRAASCSCRSWAILCARSASAFRRSSCSFSFARFSKFALMLLVLLFTTEKGETYPEYRRPSPPHRAGPGALPRDPGTDWLSRDEPPGLPAQPPPGTSLRCCVCRTCSGNMGTEPCNGNIFMLQTSLRPLPPDTRKIRP